MKKSMKVLSVALLAVFAVFGVSGAASAHDFVYNTSNDVDTGSWEDMGFWGTGSYNGALQTGSIANTDNVSFDELPHVADTKGPFKVRVKSDGNVSNLRVGAGIKAVIVIEDGKKLTVAAGSAITVGPEASLTFEGAGTLEFAGAPTFKLVSGVRDSNSVLEVNTKIKQTAAGKPEFLVPDYSELRFGGVVNDGKGWNYGSDDAQIVLPTSAVLAVSDASQLRVSANDSKWRNFELHEFKGTLEVTDTVEIVGALSIDVQQDGTVMPRFNVADGASLTLKAAPAADFGVGSIISGDKEFEKVGGGSLVLAGNGEREYRNASGVDQSANCSQMYAIVEYLPGFVVSEGDMTLLKGDGAGADEANAPAWFPKLAAKVVVKKGASLSFGNEQAVKLGSAKVKVEADGNVSVARASLVSDAEKYPSGEGVVNPDEVTFLDLVKVELSDSAVLSVEGDQAFEKVTGEGKIELADGASLILTKATKASDVANDQWADEYFIGSVEGKGGVAFAKAEQYYPFLGSKSYEGDTVVFGGAKLVVDEKTDLGVSALYLRSNEPAVDDKRTDAPDAMVGALKAVKTAQEAFYGADIRIKTLKVDASRVDSKSAVVEVDFGKNEFTPLDRDIASRRHSGRQALVVDSVSYATNRGEFTPNKFKKVYSLRKQGTGTLLLLKEGKGGDDALKDGIRVEQGRLWIFDAKALGDNNVQVKTPSTSTLKSPDYSALHVKNGLALEFNIDFADDKALFVTEVTKENKDYGSAVPAVTTKGVVTGAGMNIEGTIVQDTPMLGGSGYMVLKTSNTLPGSFNLNLGGSVGAALTSYLGSRESKDDTVMLGAIKDIFVPALDVAKAKFVKPYKPGSEFEVEIPFIEGFSDSNFKSYNKNLRLESLTGSWGSLGATELTAKTKSVVIRGNVNKNASDSYLVASILLGKPAASDTSVLPTQVVLHLTDKDAPAAGGDDLTEKVVPGKAGDWKATLTKNADGSYHFVATTSFNAKAPSEFVGTAVNFSSKPSFVVTQDGTEVAKGDFSLKAEQYKKYELKVEGNLAAANYSNAAIQSFTYKDGGVEKAADFGDGLKVSALAAEPSKETKPQPDKPKPGGDKGKDEKDGGSSGCNAGFAGLALLGLAPLFLRKKKA